MMRTLKTASLAILVASATAMLGAQQTNASTQPPKPASPATPAPADTKPAPADASKPAPPAGETYTYDPGGRRDPFLSLVGAGSLGPNQGKRGEGAAGMSVAEISVRGVLQSRGKLIAMVMGPDNKTYIVHEGDRLLDGSIKSITPQGLVIEQEVNDPLSVVKQREVRKLLRGLEDAK
jgi:Tfp pilus assembly protein PilP